jgi:hypothetical protein
MQTNFWSENFKNTEQFADVGINLRAILTWILVSEVERMRDYLRIRVQ